MDYKIIRVPEETHTKLKVYASSKKLKLYLAIEQLLRKNMEDSKNENNI